MARPVPNWLAIMFVGPIAIGLFVCGGCKSTSNSIGLARDAFASGDLDTARETLDNVLQSRNRHRDSAQLDLAMVELASGDAAAAEQRLRKLRDQFDALPDVAPVHEAASLVTDDLSRVYRPAGYEQVMIRAMLSLCSLSKDGADAESYVLQAAQRQSELARAAEDRGIVDIGELFQPVAMAPYLRGVLREATHHDYDDAARAYQLVSSVQPNFQPAKTDIARASGGVHSSLGHGVLYVVACVGRGPILQEQIAETTSTALRIASSVLQSKSSERDDDQSVPPLPNIASVKVPKVVLPASRIAAVSTHVDGKMVGVTQTLTDVSDLAVNHASAQMPWTIARAVVRRVTKEAAVANAAQKIGLDDSAASIFRFAAGSAWSGVEHADTRCWGLLPREIQVMRIELPVGKHTLLISPVDANSTALGAGQIREVEIADGRNEYLVAIAPDQAIYLAGNDLAENQQE